MKTLAFAALGIVLAVCSAVSPAAAASKKQKPSSTYHERFADRLPVRPAKWWHQMDLEQRGGRR